MARYIDIEAVGIGKAKREQFLVPEYADGWNNAIELFENEPTADVVEVVKCKDCGVPHNKWTGCPNMNGLIPPPNHFCSYGDRKST